MSKDAPIDIRAFKGLNLREPIGAVQDDELTDCINFNIGRSGELVKRTGFIELHDGSTLGLNDVIILGHYVTDAVSQILAAAGGTLYYSTDGSSWTAIGVYNAQSGVQYQDKFYIINLDSVVLEWNGSAVTALAGSPAGTFGYVYKDRLFIINSKGSGVDASKIWFSDIADFTSWPSTNFISVSKGDGQFLTALAVIHDLLILFKSNSIHALYVQGAPESWVRRIISPEIGCLSHYTPREIEGYLFFVGARGVYRTDGNIFEDISESIEPLFHSRLTDISLVNEDSAAWWEDRYICRIQFTTVNHRYMVYNLRTGGWSEWVPQGVEPAFFQEINTISPRKGLYCGNAAATGKIYLYGDEIFTDAGVNYLASFSTKNFDFSLPSFMKRGKWMGADIETLGTVDWIHISDGVKLTAQTHEAFGVATWGDDTYTWGSMDVTWTGVPIPRRAMYKLPGPGYFRTWQLKLNVQHDAHFIFYGVILYMHRKAPVSKVVT